MAQSSSSFDISKMSMGSKILAGTGVLLLIVSFLAWQEVCVLDIACASASMWGGNGSLFGTLGGIVLIALIAWEVMQIVGTNVNVGQPASKISAYLGFAAAALIVVKFLLVVTKEPAFGAFIGLILALGLAYGAWMRLQEPTSTGGFA